MNRAQENARAAPVNVPVSSRGATKGFRSLWETRKSGPRPDDSMDLVWTNLKERMRNLDLRKRKLAARKDANGALVIDSGGIPRVKKPRTQYHCRNTNSPLQVDDASTTSASSRGTIIESIIRKNIGGNTDISRAGERDRPSDLIFDMPLQTREAKAALFQDECNPGDWKKTSFDIVKSSLNLPCESHKADTAVPCFPGESLSGRWFYAKEDLHREQSIDKAFTTRGNLYAVADLPVSRVVDREKQSRPGLLLEEFPSTDSDMTEATD